MEEYVNNGCMDWEDEISSDGTSEYVLLEEGDYNFTVCKFERGQFPGSAKLPRCNKAMLTLEVATDNGTAYVNYDLILHKTLEWKIANFFISIGFKKPGENIRMAWDKIEGQSGRAHFRPREYTKKDGSTGKVNDVDKFYPYDSSDHVNDVPFYSNTQSSSNSWKKGF